MAVKRRGHGEGSIGFYGGRWVAQATIDEGGRRRFYGKTRAEANAKLQAGRPGGGREGRVQRARSTRRAPPPPPPPPPGAPPAGAPRGPPP
ncbi:MAG: hypothetical protein NVSMB29_20210 [Candidatus Dormibacteria bacterium]